MSKRKENLCGKISLQLKEKKKYESRKFYLNSSLSYLWYPVK